MMKSTSINMGGIFLEQSVKTQSKLTQMIKMLLVAYLVTGLLLEKASDSVAFCGEWDWGLLTLCF